MMKFICPIIMGPNITFFAYLIYLLQLWIRQAINTMYKNITHTVLLYSLYHPLYIVSLPFKFSRYKTIKDKKRREILHEKFYE